MTKEEIVAALLDDMEMPYLQDWQARDIVDFVLKKYAEGFPTIKGWVARDDYIFRHGCLYLYITKPRSDGNYGWCGRAVKELDTHLFPDLKWIDEPIEVELQIRPL